MSSAAITAAATASAAAQTYAAQLGVVQPLPSLRTRTGPYLWRADFDSANLQRVEYTGAHSLESTFSAENLALPDTFDCWLSSDPLSSYRVWFHFSISGARRGKQLRVCIRNLNNKKPLIGEGMLPLVRTRFAASGRDSGWKRCAGVEFRTFQSEEGAGRSFVRGQEGGEDGGEDEGEGDGAVAADDDEEKEDPSAQFGSLSVASGSPSASPRGSPSASPGHSRQSSSGGGLPKRKGSAAGSKAAASSSSSSSLSSAAANSSSAKPASCSDAAAPKKKKIKHDTMELTILHTFDVDTAEDETFVAFCLPYSYTQLQHDLLVLERKHARDSSIYFHRELLTHSLEGRRIDLLTISSHRGRLGGNSREPDMEGLYPRPTVDSKRDATDASMFSPAVPASVAALASSLLPTEPRAQSFAPSANKLLILLSARVHPGESPSSFLLGGALDFLLDLKDPRAAILRDRCIVKVVPMLNPDGVVHGYYRTDSLGQNLNRFYDAPTRKLHPSIAAVRSLVQSWQDAENAASPSSSHDNGSAGSSLWAYIDFHAHAMKRGLFVFGNHVDDARSHARNVSYARLVALNSAHLSLAACNFSARNMSARDQRDGLSKEGAGRVAFYKLTGCTHCYTCEVNYHCGRSVNVVAPLPGTPHQSTAAASAAAASQSGSTVPASASSAAAFSSAVDPSDLSWQRDDHRDSQSSCVGPPVQYGEVHWRSMGKAMMVSLLDLLPEKADDGASEGEGCANPFSRLPASEERDRAGLERWASKYLMQPPRRLVRKLAANSAGSSGSSTARAATSSMGPKAKAKAHAAARAAEAAESAAAAASPQASPKASPRISQRT